MSSEIEALAKKIYELKAELAELRRQQPRVPVRDYTLHDFDGQEVKLSELFGDKDDLIVVHNMGKSCAYCTLWADNYNGAVDHLEDRAGFAVVSPDPPAVQKKIATSRGWRFAMLSGEGSTFIEDMGFKKGDQWQPGVSTFHRDADGQITRVAQAPFGPGDDFCSVWPFFELLADGIDGWAPKYQY